MESKIYFSIAVFSLSFGIILNSFGIYILHKWKRRDNKQKFILVNLSILDILLASTELLETIIRYTSNIEHELHHKIFRTVDVSLYVMYYQLITFISLDRLLCVLLHIKYNYYVTSKRVKRIISIIWLFGLCSVLPCIFSSSDSIYKISEILFSILNFIVLLIAILTYATIGYKLKKNKMIFVSSVGKRQQQNFIVPMLIILSFAICYAIPDIVHTFLVLHESETLSIDVIIMLLLHHINRCLDPLIYIFMNSIAREIVFSMLSCRNFFSFIPPKTNSPGERNVLVVDTASHSTNKCTTTC